MTIERIETGARMSRVVIHGDTVYLAGLTANKTLNQGLAEQTQEILSLIDALLAKAGTDKSKLLKATIWLSDIRTVDDMRSGMPGYRPATPRSAPASRRCCRGRKRRSRSRSPRRGECDVLSFQRAARMMVSE